MNQTNHTDSERDPASNQAANISTKSNSAAAPNEREDAERSNQRAAENRERFIYRPLKRFVIAPSRWLITSLDNHGAAVTAIATAFIAALTFFLAKYAHDQGVIADNQRVVMQKQLSEMQRDYAAAHRPKLIIRGVYQDVNVAAPVGQQPPFLLEVIIANVGETDAHIVESYLYEEFGNSPLITIPARAPGGQNEIGNITIKPGGSWTYTRALQPITTEQKAEYADPSAGLFVIGTIVYEDENAVRRVTAIRRRFNPKTHRFERVNDPEVEYAD
jgi:hypothetical protein